MNTFGFRIESSQFPNVTEFLVFADNSDIAKDLIGKQVEKMLNEPTGWTWGNPKISEIDAKEMKFANLLWQAEE